MSPNKPRPYKTTMSLNDILFLAMRWIHNLAAVAWVGGGIYYLLILRPRLRRSPEGTPNPGRDYVSLVNTAFGVLLVTGAVLTFHRVTSGFIGVPYVVVLAVKVLLAFCMFYLVRFLSNRRSRDSASPQARKWLPAVSNATAVVILGVIVLLLADVLSSLFEQGLKG